MTAVALSSDFCRSYLGVGALFCRRRMPDGAIFDLAGSDPTRPGGFELAQQKDPYPIDITNRARILRGGAGSGTSLAHVRE